MIYAESGNCVTQIKEDEIQEFIEKGYKIIDERGRLIQDAIPNDVPNLKLAFKQHVAEIDKLHAQIDELRKQLEELEATVKKSAKKAEKPKAVEEETAEVPTEVSEVVEEEPKPKRGKRA